MKAILYRRYGGPEVLEYADVPEPAIAPGQLLVDVHVASVNPVDCKIRAGALQTFFPTTFPAIPGRDASGVVAAVGVGVTGIAVGDAVCFIAARGQGTCVERLALDAKRAIPRPRNTGHAAAAAFPLVGITAWIALVETAALGRDAKVLIHGGAGGVGGMAVQIAAHLGAEVSATCRAANRDYVLGLGAKQVFAYDAEAFERAGPVFDVVFDTMGGEVHRRSYGVLKKGGVLVYVTAAPTEDLSAQFGVSRRLAVVRDDPEPLRRLAQLIERGAAVPQVGMELPLARAAEAHRMSESGHARGKIVLKVREA